MPDTPITLPARCDRAALETLLAAARQAAPVGPVAIDGTAVEQAGLPLLQLLLAVRREPHGAHIAPSAALREAAQLVRIETELFGRGAA